MRRAYVVDDDRGVRISLVALLAASGIAARPFASAEDLLDELAHLEPGVVLIDIRLQDSSGLDLLIELRRRDCFWPTAVMTGHGDIPLAVRAIRLGAMEFLEKPFSNEVLLDAMHRGFAALPEAIARSATFTATRQLLESLSPRQREVFEGVVAGLTSKEIARRLALSHRTVEAYRSDMMKKLGTTRLVNLIELRSVMEGSERGD